MQRMGLVLGWVGWWVVVAPWAFAEEKLCPVCPEGCEAQDKIETQKVAHGETLPICPAGCVPSALVATRLAKPLCEDREEGAPTPAQLASGQQLEKDWAALTKAIHGVEMAPKDLRFLLRYFLQKYPGFDNPHREEAEGFIADLNNNRWPRLKSADAKASAEAEKLTDAERRLLQQPTGDTGTAAAETDEEEENDRQDGEVGANHVKYHGYDEPDRRIFMFPTATAPRKNHGTFDGYYLGLWHMMFGVNDYLAVGGYIVLPVMVFGIIPDILVHFPINEHVEFGVRAMGGYGGVFAYGGDGGMPGFWTFGGGPVFTFHFDKHTLNLGMMGYTYGLSGDSRDWGSDNGRKGLFFPFIGYSLRMSRRWSAFVEISPPLTYSPGSPANPDMFTAALTYGARVKGDIVFGEFGFMVPLSRWYYQWLVTYAPLGFPIVSLGFQY